VLGGIAIGAARVADLPLMHKACALVNVAAEDSALPYETAQALLDCATAEMLVGATEKALSSISKALGVAEQHGFHEFSFKAEELGERVKRSVRPPRPHLPQDAGYLVAEVRAFRTDASAALSRVNV
jgi:hypothetical protein